MITASRYQSFRFLRVLNPYPHVLLIELNRPSRLNAFHDQLYTECSEVFQQIETDNDIRAVVVGGGESKHFTAGLDLNDPTLGDILQQQNDEEPDVGRSALKLRSLILVSASLLGMGSIQASLAMARCIQSGRKIIHGSCIGAGVDFVSACDIRYASQDAKFSVKEVDIGLAADLGTLQRLGKIVGNQSFVREMCFTGRNVDAKEALERGFISTVCDSKDKLMELALRTAVEIAGKSPIAVLGTKKALLHARDHSVQDGLEFIANWNASMLQSKDLAIALLATMSKEKPKYPKL